jgi:regulator of RNase E activity RraA
LLKVIIFKLPINPNAPMMVGTAMTVETDNGDNFPIHVATYSAKPGYVMVVDGKNYQERPYFGDLIVHAAKAVGLAGIVIDGYVRDREGVTKLNFPVFSKGLLQRGVIKKNPGMINCPVKCGGIIVKPGDLVVGDSDGVTVVPREIVYEVLEKAEEKAAYEDARDAVIISAVWRRARSLPSWHHNGCWICWTSCKVQNGITEDTMNSCVNVQILGWRKSKRLSFIPIPPRRSSLAQSATRQARTRPNSA